MLDDGDRQDHTAMDNSNAQTDTQHPSTSANQQPVNLGATGQPVPAITFDPEVIANLVQAMYRPLHLVNSGMPQGH